ncbi:hypothetical protein GTW71_18420 [Streptomyces sp. SID6041]|nr:hypothetical protein [Streptomyces sp. SID6041]
MRLTAREHRIRAGRREHRVVRPWPPLRHTTVNSPLHDRWGYLGDHDGLARLAALFSFAAFSRHTLVHVPLRESLPRAYAPGTPVDLVLAHRDTGGLRPETGTCSAPPPGSSPWRPDTGRCTSGPRGATTCCSPR